MFRSVFLKTHLLLILLPLVFYGCHKSNTLYLDLTVVDSETGDPVQVSAWIYYGMEGGTDNQGTIQLGNTGEDGHMKVQKELGRKGKLELRLHGGKYYTHAMSTIFNYSQSSSIGGGKSKRTIQLKPMYHYLVSIKNVNCFDATDSVWISLNDPVMSPKYKYAGCADVTPLLGGFSNLSYTSITQQATFHVKVKRNGQVTEYDEIKNLTKGIISPISIHY